MFYMQQLVFEVDEIPEASVRRFRFICRFGPRIVFLGKLHV